MSQKEDCQKYKYSININFVKSKHFSPDLLIKSKISYSEILKQALSYHLTTNIFWGKIVDVIDVQRDCYNQQRIDQSYSKDDVVRRLIKRYKKKMSIRKGSWMSGRLLRQFIKLTYCCITDLSVDISLANCAQEMTVVDRKKIERPTLLFN